ncbi:MAG TPA: putative molybdenum carrier protein [Chthoniobacterales bacterium]|jgi:hypothetical protein
MKIISGGQTGVDRAALDVALSLGVSSGGFCPAHRLAEDGIIPERYPLEELPDGGYPERTERNVSAADGTVIFHRGPLTGGTKATGELCRERRKPCLLLNANVVSAEEAAGQLSKFVREKGLAVINVAGPRASQWPEGYDFVFAALQKFLT